jgi:hypothetical protein
VNSLDLAEADRDALLGGNAATLLHLDYVTAHR